MKHNMKIKLEWNQRDILWPHDVKSQLIGKYHDVGRDWRQEKKEKTEDEMVGWHHWFNGHEFEQNLGDGRRQGSLVCCSPWGQKELDTTERLKNKAAKRRCKPGALKSLRRGVSFVPQREAWDARGCIPIHERHFFQRHLLGYWLVRSARISIEDMDRAPSFKNE